MILLLTFTEVQGAHQVRNVIAKVNGTGLYYGMKGRDFRSYSSAEVAFLIVGAGTASHHVDQQDRQGHTKLQDTPLSIRWPSSY